VSHRLAKDYELRPNRRLVLCIVGVGWALPALTEGSCSDPVLTAPAHKSTQSSVRPTISWQAVSAASGYRLRLVSREPEGRSFATIDTIVGSTRFVPPQALSDGFALVRVSVASQCGADHLDSLSSSGGDHRFLIDARPACPLAGLHAEASERRLRWEATAGANAYEVFAYEPADGSLLFKPTTTVPNATLPAHRGSPTSAATVLAVRARCGEVSGQISHLVY